MEYRLIGHSGTIVSRSALNTMFFDGETSVESAFSIRAHRPINITDPIVLATKGRNATHKGMNAAGLSQPSGHIK